MIFWRVALPNGEGWRQAADHVVQGKFRRNLQSARTGKNQLSCKQSCLSWNFHLFLFIWFIATQCYYRRFKLSAEVGENKADNRGTPTPSFKLFSLWFLSQFSAIVSLSSSAHSCVRKLHEQREARRYLWIQAHRFRGSEYNLRAARN